ncbi:unnamed protein product, partial [Rotaria sp. Silwood2]
EIDTGEVDDEEDNSAMMIATQQPITTQSRFQTASSITFDSQSSRTYFKMKYWLILFFNRINANFSAESDEVEKENYDSDSYIFDYRWNSAAKNGVNKRKSKSNSINQKRKRMDNKS